MEDNFAFIVNNDSRTPFERSLDEFSQSDVDVLVDKKPAKSQIAFNIFRYTLMIALIGVFVYCVLNIASKSVQSIHAGDIYDDLAQKFESDDFGFVEREVPLPARDVMSPPLADYDQLVKGQTPETDEPTTVVDNAASAKIKELKAINPDCVAWIMVDGTSISYPVVQNADSDYYLRRDFTGEESWTGSIFMDSANSDKLMENKNTVIFGHNLASGLMFSHITKFLNEDFFKNNRYITVYTEEGIFTYEIFAILKVNENDRYYHCFFDSDREFLDFLYEKKYQSIFVTDMDFTEEDRIITLSTCTNEDHSERYGLQGKLISFE